MNSQPRREFLKASAGSALASAFPSISLSASDSPAFARHSLSDTDLIILSDGYLQQPVSRVLPESLIDKAEREAFLQSNTVTASIFQPDCNVTLWRVDDRLILFDTGAGSQFIPTAGVLLDSLAEADIEPADITDVIFTHAHPDHLWGLVDDFDELTFPNAAYHIGALEWDYWQAESTLDKTPDERKSFVVGAQNRLPYIDEQVKLFNIGDEIVSGVEAVDTRGHTPGHTSFALHRGNERVLILGDAITNVLISFQKPNWLSGSDQDPELARTTRMSLLDRLAHEQMLMIGFHLPHPGLGLVERQGAHYRFQAVG